ncbi:MAG: hypothetical protein LBC61_02135 [Candidatus Peribacteria bacterium]|jgi:hypothetical protein|nr:hypothetical protein [Candidatus Peribacteria bacterium]
MLVYESMPYNVYEKLMTIEDTTFRDFLRMALVENFEDYILERQREGIVISPYEEVFLNCNIPYSEREKIIIDFITDLKDTKNVDLTSLTYSNPKFGDCVVPYPDKRNIAKVVPGSFDSNQLLAKQLS